MASCTYADRQTDIHTHTSCNAVTLVWGLLRLAPIICDVTKAVLKYGKYIEKLKLTAQGLSHANIDDLYRFYV